MGVFDDKEDEDFWGEPDFPDEDDDFEEDEDSM